MKPPSPAEPNLVTLRGIAEARHILTEVITSSESFNYLKAKEGLKQLDRIIRDLGREEARLRAIGNTSDGAKVVPFPIDHAASKSS